MEFNYPEAFWLLLLIIPLYYFTRNSIADLPRGRFIISFSIRIIIFILIIAAISEIQIVKPNTKLCVIFVTDLSKSITGRNKEDIKSFISKALEKKNKDDEAGLIIFGGNAFIEFIPSSKPKVTDFTSIVETNHTNIAGALQLALAMFPGDANRRIVLLSDGQENMGDALAEASIVASNQVPVDVVPLDSLPEREIFINQFDLPEMVNIDEPFDAKVVLESTFSGSVKLQFYRNNKLAGEKVLSINPGKNVFFIPQEVQSSGFYGYEVQLITDRTGDTIVENNRAWAYTKALGKPSVIIINGDKKDVFLTKALEFEGLNVFNTTPDNMPVSLPQFQNYQCIVLNNVSATQMSSEQMKFIQIYVRDLGGGLIMIGGENSFGVGGYYETPVEEALPVSMDIRKDRKMPSMALVLAIDKSGSMADFGPARMEKIALAREAAIACVHLLAPNDQIGVIGFDDAAKWITPFQKRADNKEAIARDIATLRAGGGTDAYPALKIAESVLSRTEAILKHIILLSDGRTAPGDFDGIVETMNSHKITLSCVGIGQDADILFLQSISKKGGGRFYHTFDVRMLPRIFTKEALIASRSAILEKSFTPDVNKYGQILQGIDWEMVPPLGGYVITTPKDRAEVLLITKEEDPLLVQWHYGLGKSLAFTSDAKNRWATKWIKWKDFPAFWAQALRWTMKDTETSLLDVSASFENGEGKIVVDAVNEEGDFMNLLDLHAKIISPSMKNSELALKQEGPGRYETTFPCPELGTYLINAGGENTGYEMLSFDFSMAPEYKTFGANRFLLARIAQETGGRNLELKNYNMVFDHSIKQSFQVKELWPMLIMWVLFLFPLDIAIRRIFLPEDWMEKVLKRFKLPERIVKVHPDIMLSKLKSKKSEVIKDREEKVSIASIQTDFKVRPLIIKEEKPAKEIKPPVKEETGSSLSRLKSVKKKALDDFNK